MLYFDKLVSPASAGQTTAAQLMCWLDSDYDKTRLRSFSPRLYSAMHPAGRWADPRSAYTYCK